VKLLNKKIILNLSINPLKLFKALFLKNDTMTREERNYIKLMATDRSFYHEASFIHGGSYRGYLTADQDKIGNRLVQEYKEEKPCLPTNLVIDTKKIGENSACRIKKSLESKFKKSTITLEWTE
jgi:hypothetical protein